MEVRATSKKDQQAKPCGWRRSPVEGPGSAGNRVRLCFIPEHQSFHVCGCSPRKRRKRYSVEFSGNYRAPDEVPGGAVSVNFAMPVTVLSIQWCMPFGSISGQSPFDGHTDPFPCVRVRANKRRKGKIAPPQSTLCPRTRKQKVDNINNKTHGGKRTKQI